MGQPNVLVLVALAAFVLFAAQTFSRLEPRRALVLALLAGWLFLPHFDYRLSIPYLATKAMYLGFILLACSVVFDVGRWGAPRVRLLDLPILVFCVQPFFTAMSNDLGAKEGISAALEATLSWGAPYLLARMYLGGRRGTDLLARGLVVGALVYAPLALIEVRLSPQLHWWLYGFRSWAFNQSIRLGGFRPSVFMQHGLALGMFMTIGSLVAYWRWRTGAGDRIAGVSPGAVAAGLIVTTVLCRSTGALALLALGIALVEVALRLRTGLAIVALAALPTVFCAARIAGWEPSTIVEYSARFDPARAGSVQFRFDNERLLVEKAMIRPALGWGRFGRSFLYDEDGQSLGAVVDSLWIIVLGIDGLVGLVAVGLVLALPPLAFLRRFPARTWSDPRVASGGILALVLLLWAIDDLLNAMHSPIYPAIAGALVSTALGAREARRRPAATAPRARAPAARAAQAAASAPVRP